MSVNEGREIVKQKQQDFWDHVLAFINEAHDECSKMVARGKLGEFEKQWDDPIAKLSKHNWFAEAKATAKKLADEGIRIEVRKMVEYYRFAAKCLDADFG